MVSKLMSSRTALLLLALLMLTSCARAAKAPTELFGNIGVHDPTMIKADGVYYVFSTGDQNYGSGNIQIRKSADMETWSLVGVVFPKQPAWIAEELGVAPPNLWAPDISYFNGKYHLYYAGSTFGSNSSVIGLATNATLDPESPDYAWRDEGMVVRSRTAFNWNAIDPNVAFDESDTPWLSLGSFWSGIKLQRLDAGTGKLSEEDTELYDLASRGGGPIEAPAIVRRGDFYYLFVSFDTCCRGLDSTYKIMVGRAEQITGPYLDRAGIPMLGGGGTLLLDSRGRYHGPGGQAVVLDDGVYRLVHHYYDREQSGAPKLQIHDLGWTADGWPEVAER
jgi:arabinan endo-1,5-alpha-L-arabinosidase